MANALLQAIITFFNQLVLLTFQPIFGAVNNILQTLNLGPTISDFATFLTDYVAPFIAFFLNFLTPKAMNVIILELTVTILFFNLSLVMHIGLKVLKLIKKLPLA